MSSRSSSGSAMVRYPPGSGAGASLVGPAGRAGPRPRSARGAYQLTDFIGELLTLADADMDFHEGLPVGHARQDFARHFRQERSGENAIDVARTCLYLLAAAGNQVDQRVVIGEGRPVVGAHPVADAAKLQFDDLPQNLIGEWKIRDDREPPQERRLERL